MPSTTDRLRTPGNSQAAAIRLSIVLLGGGAMHFVIPKRFDSIIPSRLPGSPRIYTYVAGAANLCVGAGLAIPRTRKVSSGLAATLFVAYMPAKIKLAVDGWRSERLPMPAKIAGLVQLVWQVPLVTESLKVRRNAPRRSGGHRRLVLAGSDRA
ncbi:MAG: hypothetical protein GEU98_16845 [Pseudonocardiaceae bacterium]|nr:hypothetical protein [Pseudonocardiaceae bacterium]